MIFSYPLDFFLAMLAIFLFFASMHLLLAPLPLYVEAVGGQPAQIGLVMGALTLTAILSRPQVGRWADTWGRKPMLLLGALIFSVTPLLYIAARSVPALLVVRLIPGLGLSCFTTAYAALIADLVPAERRGEAMGVGGMAVPLSMMIAPALGTSLMQALGFTPLFMMAALLALLSLGVVFLLSDRPLAPSETGNNSFFQVIRQRGIWVTSLAIGVTGISYGAIITFLPLFAVERHLGNVGFFFSVYSLAFIASRMPAGRLSDQWGRVPVSVVTMLVLALAFGMLAGVGEMLAFLIVAVVYGVSFGGSRTVLDALVADEAPVEGRGAAMSVAYCCFDLGIGTGSIVLGLVADVLGYGGMYGVVGVVCLLGLAAFWGMMKA
ncbi:MAG: MFS transporter [Anaerolineae bacterium]